MDHECGHDDRPPHDPRAIKGMKFLLLGLLAFATFPDRTGRRTFISHNGQHVRQRRSFPDANGTDRVHRRLHRRARRDVDATRRQDVRAERPADAGKFAAQGDGQKCARRQDQSDPGGLITATKWARHAITAFTQPGATCMALHLGGRCGPADDAWPSA